MQSTDFEVAEVEDFAEALLNDRFPHLQLITLGCAYEPLMGKDFERYPGAIQELHEKLKVRIVTNGALLHRKDIAPWVDFGLEKLYVSVYSHIPELYEGTARGAGDFKQIEKNLLETRRRFPTLEITLTNPISKANDVDIVGFCRWAFDYVGASSVDLRRAFFVEKPAAGYPAFTYTEAATAELGRSPAIYDEEWSAILHSCTGYMTNSQKRTIKQTTEIRYDSIVLSAPSAVPVAVTAA